MRYLSTSSKTIFWLNYYKFTNEEDAEVKRSFVFALIFGYDNTHIDEVREIPKGLLNNRIRQIKLEKLLEHKDNHHYLMKCWKYYKEFLLQSELSHMNGV